MNSTNAAISILEDIIEKGIVSVAYEHNAWTLKWDNSHSRIFLVVSSLNQYEDYDDSREAFRGWYEAGRARTITVFSGLPVELEKAIREWQRMWNEEKEQEKLEYYRSFIADYR